MDEDEEEVVKYLGIVKNAIDTMTATLMTMKGYCLLITCLNFRNLYPLSGKGSKLFNMSLGHIFRSRVFVLRCVNSIRFTEALNGCRKF